MEDEDRGWVAAARAGDAAAFERLVARHADLVFRIVAAWVGRSDAEDAAQEVFIRVHQGLDGFSGDASFKTWLVRIANNVGATRGERRRRRGVPLDDTDGDEPAGRSPPPVEDALAAERRVAVRAALDELPDKERAVAVLRAMEGMSFDEVAAALGIGRSTAESRMGRAKERLRKMLARFLDD